MSVPRSLTSVFRNATTILPALIVYSFCLLLSISAYAVDCLPDTGLSTQADVNNFQTDYGPCDTITQHLTIDGGPYANLDGLNSIITMTDGLTIEFTSVASLAGLSNLVTIGGRFQIQSQLGGSFSSLSGLSSLTSLGELHIADTNFLTSLSGMTSLTSLGGLHLGSADVLTNLVGLPAGLNTIKHLRFESNDQLQSLDGLGPQLAVENLTVEDNPNLTSISALAGSVFNNVYGFPAFDDTTPSLGITDNPKLSSLHGVPSVLSPGAFSDLVIVDNPLINSLSVLDGVVEIWGDHGFFRNEALSDCASLSTVMDVVDDGFPGPNEYTSDPSILPPDLRTFGDEIGLGSNASGCNSIAEILGSGSGDGVFMDGFEAEVP